MVNLDGISGNTQLPAVNFGKSLCFWGLLGIRSFPLLVIAQAELLEGSTKMRGDSVRWSSRQPPRSILLGGFLAWIGLSCPAIHFFLEELVVFVAFNRASRLGQETLVIGQIVNRQQDRAQHFLCREKMANVAPTALASSAGAC